MSSIDYSSSLDNIATLIKARIPYIWVTTYEESRFVAALNDKVTKDMGKELWTWSSNQGLIRFDPDELTSRASGDEEKTNNPGVALGYIEKFKGEPRDLKDLTNKGSVWVLKDFNAVLAAPIARQMRDLYRTLIRTKKTVIILSPSLTHAGGKAGIEPTLDKQITVVPYTLPGKEEIEARVRGSVSRMKGNKSLQAGGVKFDYTTDEYNIFAMALSGLTELEIDNAIVTSVCHLKKIDEKKLLHEKKQIIQRSEILEYIGLSASMEDVGGLDLAKKYFSTYAKQFTKEAADYGVEPLKGVLLTGIPGAGKSLLAKAISSTWNLPLLRLDIGKVMQGLVGASEENMRKALAQAQAVAPTVLWVDEIEKALSGTKSSGSSDGGTLSRVFGTLLTAMEEELKNVVVIATANDIQALPPELIRRFNEVMFVDLPQPEEREEIFKIHLRKRKRDVSCLNLNMAELVKVTHLFTGSEIEKAVKEAIARAFQRGAKDVEQEDLFNAAKDTKCIAHVMKDQIDAIREWAQNKARYASSLALAANAPGKQKVVTKTGKELDLSKDLNDLDEIATTGNMDQFDNLD